MTTIIDAPVLPAQQASVYDAVFSELPPPCPTAPAELHRRLEALLGPGFGDDMAPLRLSTGVLHDAARCPASTLPAPFAWSAVSATRRLGIGALSAMARRRADPMASIREAVADEIDAHTSLGGWLETLEPPALASVEVQAASFAARAWVAVPFHALAASARAVWFRKMAVRVRPVPSLDAVVLEGRADATVRTGPPGTTDRVVLRLGSFDDRTQRLDALVNTLAGCSPLRCVHLDPASGHASALDLDAGVLHQAVEEAAAALKVLATSRTDERPGPHCRWCHRRSQCPSAAAGDSTALAQPPGCAVTLGRPR